MKKTLIWLRSHCKFARAAGNDIQLVVQLPNGTWISPEGKTQDLGSVSIFDNYEEARSIAESMGGEVIRHDKILSVPQTRLVQKPGIEDKFPKVPGSDTVPWEVEF